MSKKKWDKQQPLLLLCHFTVTSKGPEDTMQIQKICKHSISESCVCKNPPPFRGNLPLCWKNGCLEKCSKWCCNYFGHIQSVHESFCKRQSKKATPWLSWFGCFVALITNCDARDYIPSKLPELGGQRSASTPNRDGESSLSSHG